MENLHIGIDIGGTNLRCALVNESGKILHRSRMTSDIELGREAFCKRLMAGVSEVRSAAKAHAAEVVAIGAGVPGLVGRDGLIHSSVNMRPLDGFNLAVFLEQQAGLPSACGNDANVIAQGEHLYGAGRSLNSFMVITIGTGLGSGLILDGRLWSGVGGFAAEFGHVTVDPEGLTCPCGNRGCLEQYISAGAIVRYVRGSLPSDVIGLTGSNPDAAFVATLARQGNAEALEAFSHAGRWLGIALASLANTLNLEAIIIGGGVGASLDLLLPALRKEIASRCFPQIAAMLDIRVGMLGDDAGLLGGAALARWRINS